MKAVLINGSPRKNWNTHKLLLSAEEGLNDAGVETEVYNLYDLTYTGCKSCFACKIRNNKTNGICVLKDDLKPVLQSIHESDAVIIASPIYYSNLTGETLSFTERLMFPIMQYEINPDTGLPLRSTDKTWNSALILTMNVPEETLKQGMDKQYENYANILARVLGGTSSVVYSCDTYQFKDYSKYYSGIFDEKHKADHREKQFPTDLKNAYNLGKTILK